MREGYRLGARGLLRSVADGVDVVTTAGRSGGEFADPGPDTLPRAGPNGVTTPRPAGSKPADTVVVTLPASSAYLSVLRTATAGLAARLHFTLDEIEDLRIAVDEACAMLLAGEELPDHDLTCRFELDLDEIAVTVMLPSVRRAMPAQDTFAWQVLNALAGKVDATLDDGHLTLALTKRRGRAP